MRHLKAVAVICALLLTNHDTSVACNLLAYGKGWCYAGGGVIGGGQFVVQNDVKSCTIEIPSGHSVILSMQGSLAGVGYGGQSGAEAGASVILRNNSDGGGGESVLNFAVWDSGLASGISGTSQSGLIMGGYGASTTPVSLTISASASARGNCGPWPDGFGAGAAISFIRMNVAAPIEPTAGCDESHPGNCPQVLCTGCGAPGVPVGGTVIFSEIDRDGDGVFDSMDNADEYWNPGQEDTDADGIANVIDSCPNAADPLQLDTDSDRVGDVCDCDVSNATVGGAPDEIAELQMNGSFLVWETAALSLGGTAATHDVIRGHLGGLPVGTGLETCLANDQREFALVDSLVPGLGEGFWYLVRSRNACGVGTFGFSSDGTQRVSSACQ